MFCFVDSTAIDAQGVETKSAPIDEFNIFFVPHGCYTFRDLKKERQIKSVVIKKSIKPLAIKTDSNFFYADLIEVVIPMSCRTRVGKRKISPNVPHVHIKDVSFHIKSNVTR